MLKLDASYINGLSEADLAVALKAAGVPVRGFARRPEVAPRQLLVKTVVQAVPSRPELLEHLAELWALRHPALSQECQEVAGRLADPNFDGGEWVRGLAQRVGEEGALQALLFSSCLGSGLMEQVLTPELLAELRAGARGAPAALEPEAPCVAERRAQEANEAEVRRLGRRIRALESELGRLEQRLKATLASLRELQAENQRLREQLELFGSLADLPEPRERVRRLVAAILKMMKEQARLREELAVARGH